MPGLNKQRGRAGDLAAGANDVVVAAAASSERVAERGGATKKKKKGVARAGRPQTNPMKKMGKNTINPSVLSLRRHEGHPRQNKKQ